MLQARSALVIAPMLVGLLAQPPSAHAEDFYKGKTVTFLVGFTTGGGFDRNARVVAAHIGKHIPGNPSIIVQNSPGAGSLTSVRALDANQPKDGTVVNVF